MTRTTNARVAGFTYLFYAAIGACIELLMHHARGAGVGGDAAMLARIGEHATDVRLSILIALLECLSSFVLAVTLYSITRVEDHELAMLGLVCRVAEGLLGSLSNIPAYLGMLWLAKAGGGPDIPTTNALRAFVLMPGASVLIGSIFFAVGSFIFSFLLLRGRMVPVSIAWLGVFASGLLAVTLPLQLAGFSTGPLTGYYQWLPALVFQVVLALWLLIKGVAPPATADRAAA
jgi:hypothetical protein